MKSPEKRNQGFSKTGVSCIFGTSSKFLRLGEADQTFLRMIMMTLMFCRKFFRCKCKLKQLYLGGGFKYCLCSSLFGEMIQSD